MRCICAFTLLTFVGLLGCGSDKKVTQTRPCEQFLVLAYLSMLEPILPYKSEAEMLPDGVDIEITPSEIRVRRQRVVSLKSGKVVENDKRDGPDGFFIDPLFKKLQEEAKQLKEQEKRGGRPFTGFAILVVYKGASYRLVSEVLYTINQAEFKSFAFAIFRGAE